MLSQPPVWLILIAFVCALGPLVFIHEMGHYLVARWFGVGAETFSIGFGQEITGWTDKRGTRWKVGWLPLGGYVKFIGDEHAASAPGDLSQLSPEERARSFHLKPVWQRFLIVLAGPVSNFLLAIAIFAVFFASFGAPRTPPVVGASAGGQRCCERPRSSLATASSRSAAGRRRPSRNCADYVVLRPGEVVTVRFEREQQVHDVRLSHSARTRRRTASDRATSGDCSASRRLTSCSSRCRRCGSFPTRPTYVVKLTRTMLDALWQIITGRRSVKELGGPLKIAQVAGQQATLGLVAFVSLVALLSINLGFINLLPVPMLDGGHLLFYGIEAVQASTGQSAGAGLGVPRRTRVHSRPACFSQPSTIWGRSACGNGLGA